MQTIQLNVHSNHIDFLLSMLQNLKDGIVVDRQSTDTSTDNHTIRLTSRDSELFLEALDRPPKIYPKLKEAFKEYEKSQIEL